MPPRLFERHPDRQLVRKKSRRFLRALTESEVRVPTIWQILFQRLAKVRALVLLRAQPAVPAVREHSIQEHQSLDEAA